MLLSPSVFLLPHRGSRSRSTANNIFVRENRRTKRTESTLKKNTSLLLFATGKSIPSIGAAIFFCNPYCRSTDFHTFVHIYLHGLEAQTYFTRL